jgi:hypothetical protein
MIEYMRDLSTYEVNFADSIELKEILNGIHKLTMLTNKKMNSN